MIGARLRSARDQKGLRQEDMSESLEMTRAAYARYENETSEPNLVNLKLICEKLEISADWLLGIDSKLEAKTEGDILQGLVSMRNAGVSVSDALFPDDDKSAPVGYADRGIIAVYISENLSSTLNTLKILESNVRQAEHEVDKQRLQQNVDNYIKGQIEFLKDKPVQKCTDIDFASKIGIEYSESLLYAKHRELSNKNEE